MAERRKATGGCWPTAEQELLLKAALFKDDRGLQAFGAWRGQTDFDHPGEAAVRLFPLLYRNLVFLGLKDPIINILKGFYRRALYKNHLLMHSLSQALAAFNREGIDAMPLKGTAVTLTSYKDYGLRPMNDFDLLIRPQSLGPAVRLLKEEGWTVAAPTLLEQMFANVRHACEFTHNSGQTLDLHQYMFGGRCFDGVDEPFWGKSRGIDLNGIPTRVPDDADQLLHAAVHGGAWNDVPPIRWVADAAMLLGGRGGTFPWDRLLEQAGRLGFTLVLRDALIYLRDRLDQPVPAEVIATFVTAPVGLLEKLSNRTRFYPAGSLPSYAGFLLRYLRFPPTEGLWGTVKRVARFPDYLRRFWCLERTTQVPLFLLRKAWASLRRAPGRH